MSAKIALSELEQITALQKELHLTESATDPIISILYRENQRVTRVTTIPIKCEGTTNGNTTVYSVNGAAHYLMYSYLRYKLPRVTVNPDHKSKIRIAWCHNPGHNKIVTATLKADTTPLQSFDNHWLDFNSQFFQRGGAGKRESDRVAIGSVSALTDWQTDLPSCWLNIDQPWFYSIDTTNALPLHNNSTNTKICHEYMFRETKNLLRVQRLSNGKWTDLKYIQWSKYVKIGPEAEPELWCRYGFASEQELCEGNRNEVIYTHDVECCDDPKMHKLKDQVNCGVNCINPCLAAFWAAKNFTASVRGYHSNYSTNSEDLLRGDDPITSTSLKYGTSYRFKDMSSDHFNVAESRHHCTSAPDEPGYHTINFEYIPHKPGPAFGVVFSGREAVLVAQLGDRPELIENDADQTDIIPLDGFDTPTTSEIIPPPESVEHKSNDNEYQIIVRLLVLKKLSITLKDGMFSYTIE